MDKKVYWSLIGLCWLTAFMRFKGLFDNDFHADEALFATWARYIAVLRDPLLLTQSVDKPPLLFYLQALFYPLQGPVEWAARLPNFMGSLLLIPLVGGVTWRLFRHWQLAVFAAGLTAFSPLHIQFSSSAFTDPLLTTFLFASFAWLIDDRQRPFSERSRRIRLSGLFFGLAILTKHQGWLFLPLFIGLGLVWRWRRAWRCWFVGLLPCLLLGWGWELARNGRFSLFSQQIDNVGGIHIAPFIEWPTRLITWARLSQFVVHPLWVGLFIGGLVGIILLSRIQQEQVANVDTQHAALLGLLALFIFGYSGLHLLIDIPVWDRYLLPMVPFTAVFLAALFNLLRTFDMNYRPSKSFSDLAVKVWASFLIVVIIFTLFGGGKARVGGFPIGARPFADSGASEVSQLLADEPYGTVLYDHWFSWHWRYHLFDKRVHLSWFPDDQTLVEDLDKFYSNSESRYLALPADARGEAVQTAVFEAGYRLQQMPTSAKSDIILFKVERN